MGRTILAAVIATTCLLPAIARAQRSSSPPPPPAPPSAPAPQPGVPLVPPAPPSALDRVDIFRATPGTYAPQFDQSFRRNPFNRYGGYGYIGDPFGYISQPESSSPVLDRYMRNTETTGYLRIDVEPEDAQVYVDGFYAGTVADFRRGGRSFDAGPHRIEIRADGYEPQSVELRIRANDTLAYRGTLTKREQRAELRSPAATPKTFYVIPRCYAGTSRPRAEQLPPGCRVADLRTVPPVVAPAPRQ